MNQPQHQPTPRKPVATAATLASLTQYSKTVEIQCEDCEGSGRDRGSLDNFLNGTEPVCPTCQGRCTEEVARNYLSEALAIAANPDSTRVVEYHAIGRRAFEELYHLDIEALILKLNEKPVVRIMGGYFMATLAGEEYNLGPVRKPLGKAMHSAIQIARERPLVMRL
jgi:hypothetical protein